MSGVLTKQEQRMLVQELREPEPLPCPSAALSFTNGLQVQPYIPKDPDRAKRLLEAIEMINRERATTH